MKVQAYVFIDAENPGPKRVVKEVRKIPGVVRADALFRLPAIVARVEGEEYGPPAPSPARRFDQAVPYPDKAVRRPAKRRPNMDRRRPRRHGGSTRRALS